MASVSRALWISRATMVTIGSNGRLFEIYCAVVLCERGRGGGSGVLLGGRMRVF